MKNILLFLVIIYCNQSCTREKVHAPSLFSEEFTTESYIEQPQEASCIPSIPIEIDTNAVWRGLGELYEGLAEYGRGFLSTIKLRSIAGSDGLSISFPLFP